MSFHFELLWLCHFIVAAAAADAARAIITAITTFSLFYSEKRTTLFTICFCFVHNTDLHLSPKPSHTHSPQNCVYVVWCGVCSIHYVLYANIYYKNKPLGLIIAFNLILGKIRPRTRRRTGCVWLYACMVCACGTFNNNNNNEISFIK